MNHSHRIAWQKGNIGVFAEIALNVQSATGQQHMLVIEQSIGGQMKDAIRFGVALFLESFGYRQKEIAECAIVVQSVKIVPGDTTTCSLAYVTFHALCNAFDIDGKVMFDFDSKSGSFLITTAQAT
jgi:hypothetical protein